MARTITETVGGMSYEYSPITEETAGLVFGDRNEAYGHPVEDFSKTAGFWTVYKGVAFTPEDVAQMMSLVKVSRQMHRPQRDNPVDNCGYQECLQRIVEARAAGVPITDWEWVAQSVESLLGAVEELDRINELVPLGVSIEDMVACWHANHVEPLPEDWQPQSLHIEDTATRDAEACREFARPGATPGWIGRALQAIRDAGIKIDDTGIVAASMRDEAALIEQAAKENWSINALNRALNGKARYGLSLEAWDAVTTMAAADAYNEHWRKVNGAKDEKPPLPGPKRSRADLIAHGSEERLGG